KQRVVAALSVQAVGTGRSAQRVVPTSTRYDTRPDRPSERQNRDPRRCGEQVRLRQPEHSFMRRPRMQIVGAARAGPNARLAKHASAEGGNRTPPPRREPDFESGASASSATSARHAWYEASAASAGVARACSRLRRAAPARILPQLNTVGANGTEE